MGTLGTIALVSIERSGTKGRFKYRDVVRYKGAKRHTSWVGSEAEAKMLGAALRVEMGGTPSATGHTVSEVVAGYIAASTHLSPETLRDYRIGAALIPQHFGDRDVSQVRPLHLDALYAEMRGTGASEHKVRKVHKTLSVSINRAIKYGWCQSNPCRAADKPQVRTAEIVPPTPEQVREIIAAQSAVNEDTATCFRLAAATGMRRGELVGLQRRDVKGQSISIRRSLVWDAALKVMHVRPTKTGSRGHRTIRISAGMAEALEAMMERQVVQCTEAELPVPEWIFTHDLETPWRPDYLTTTFSQRMASLGLDFSLHDFRHFHATQLLAAGVPVPQVSSRLGHSSPAVTLNTYAHWIPANDQSSADIIEALL
ncbi:MAG: site-specific recombinase, phage integrase family [Ilumatobacteraceae bacterium]|nr:site-specific recombinase, phage integrase family [Ilumatobacteraceae bacterium]